MKDNHTFQLVLASVAVIILTGVMMVAVVTHMKAGFDEKMERVDTAMDAIAEDYAQLRKDYDSLKALGAERAMDVEEAMRDDYQEAETAVGDRFRRLLGQNDDTEPETPSED